MCILYNKHTLFGFFHAFSVASYQTHTAALPECDYYERHRSTATLLTTQANKDQHDPPDKRHVDSIVTAADTDDHHVGPSCRPTRVSPDTTTRHVSAVSVGLLACISCVAAFSLNYTETVSS